MRNGKKFRIVALMATLAISGVLHADSARAGGGEAVEGWMSQNGGIVAVGDLEVDLHVEFFGQDADADLVALLVDLYDGSAEQLHAIFVSSARELQRLELVLVPLAASDPGQPVNALVLSVDYTGNFRMPVFAFADLEDGDSNAPGIVIALLNESGDIDDFRGLPTSRVATDFDGDGSVDIFQ